MSRNWMWLLFPIGLIVYAIGRLGRPTVKVVSGEVAGADDVAKKARAWSEREIEEADQRLREQRAQVELRHKEAVESLTDDQKKKVAEFDDPQDLNDYLLEVGRKARLGD